jgi:hypothetical protein
MGRVSRHLSYANVAATLALVFAMTGGAIAATGGFTSNGKLQACVNGGGGLTLLKAGKKCKRGQKTIAWNQKGPAGPKGAPGTSGIAALNGAPVPSATNATNATTAQTASNALSLGGTPATGFTHNDCVSKTGQIKGFALVPEKLPATFTPLGTAYNCSGQSVEARHIGTGEYDVRFNGNPSGIALGTSNAGSEGVPDVNTIAVISVGPGQWHVKVWNDVLNTELDGQFELLIP